MRTMTKNNVVKGRDVVIHPSAQLLAEELVIGDFSKIGPNVVISGKSIHIGREAWITTGVLIGGGRSEWGSLRTGDFLHLGKDSMVNTANEVAIGDEVGIGMNGKIFSHGAYLSEYDGFPYQDAPVRIGSNVWLPYAVVSPGVTIGDNVVVGAMSLVNRDLPSGCLAGGIPVKILKESVYPKEISQEEKKQVLDKIVGEIARYSIRTERDPDGTSIIVEKTVFDIPDRKIEGPANKETDRVKDLLRRHGIRFKYYNDGKVYKEWD
jgi:acetyltransferase-like isoleucine patch superfamily enzyme